MVKNLLMLLDAGRSALTPEPRTVFHMDVEGNPAKGEAQSTNQISRLTGFARHRRVGWRGHGQRLPPDVRD